jgi:hypothetical protein
MVQVNLGKPTIQVMRMRLPTKKKIEKKIMKPSSQPTHY